MTGEIQGEDAMAWEKLKIDRKILYEQVLSPSPKFVLRSSDKSVE
jgi:hypothetical protein